MKTLEKIHERIYALRIPFEDIFTSVFFVITERGTLIFDTATHDRDVEDAILPALRTLGIRESDLKYIFISHDHGDHAGGLSRLLKACPEACVVARSEALGKRISPYAYLSPREGEVLLGALRVVFITGHTQDSIALLDLWTKTLISGDCLQLFGVFGSGCWGANVSFYKRYTEAIRALRETDLEMIAAAHDYYPCGRTYRGKAGIAEALDACLAPFAVIGELIKADPAASDELLCERYNALGAYPRLGAHVIGAYRKAEL